MDRESVERLRFDRRLKARTGWVDAETEEAYLEALPDVSEKMTTCAEEEDAAEAAAEEAAVATPPPTPELQPQAPAPIAGDFSTSISTSAPQPPAAAPSTSPPPAPSSVPEPSEPSTPPDQGSAGTFPGEQAAQRTGAGSFGGDTETN